MSRSSDNWRGPDAGPRFPADRGRAISDLHDIPNNTTEVSDWHRDPVSWRTPRCRHANAHALEPGCRAATTLQFADLLNSPPPCRR